MRKGSDAKAGDLAYSGSVILADCHDVYSSSIRFGAMVNDTYGK